MSDFPKSRAEAERTRYGKWAGHPNGNAFDPRYCAAHTTTGGRGSLPKQCGSKPGHGTDGLFCKRHGLEESPPKPFPVWEIGRRHLSFTKREGIDETDAFITMAGGRREAKATEWSFLCSNEEQARARAINLAESQIKSAERDIEAARKFIQSIQP